MNKFCKNCIHFFDTCQCNWLLEIEKMLTYSKHLGKDYYKYKKINPVALQEWVDDEEPDQFIFVLIAFALAKDCQDWKDMDE